MTNVFGRIRGFEKKTHTERERNIIDVNKEDFLIKQIDEFKEKAKQLQQLLDFKENKVEELQHIVDEREQKAQNLQNVLRVRQQEADKVNQSVDVHVEQISKKLEGQIGQMNRGIDAKMAQVAVQLDDGVQGMEQQLQVQNQQLNELKEQIGNIVSELNKGTDDQLKASVEELVTKLDTMKNELSEKVHTENVKSYRNIQTLMEELDGKLGQVELGDNSMKTMKGYLKAIIVLGVLNLVAVAGLILYEVGIFNFIL